MEFFYKGIYFRVGSNKLKLMKPYNYALPDLGFLNPTGKRPIEKPKKETVFINQVRRPKRRSALKNETLKLDI